MEEYVEELIESNDNIIFEEVVGDDIITDGNDEEIIIENSYKEDEIDVCNEDEDNDDYNSYSYDMNNIVNNVEENIELNKSNNFNENNDYYSLDNISEKSVKQTHDNDLHTDIIYDNIEIENVDNTDDQILNNNEDINDCDNNSYNNFDNERFSETEECNNNNYVEISSKKTSSNLLSNFKFRHRKTNQFLKNSLQNSNNMKGMKITWQRRTKPLNHIKQSQSQKISEFNPSYSKLNFSINKNKTNHSNHSYNENEVRRNRGRPKRGEFVTPVFKVTDCQPLDIAAHLNLLSNSLSNIGSRLMEENGEVSVDDSVSVLLDSLVCVLSSLLPLTSQIELLKDHGQNMKERYLELLDNIAYIMPGVTK